MPESRPKSSSRSRASATPVYSLYGEDGQAQALDGLHLESIAERSRLHNWEIQPHRHGALVQLLLIERGRVVVRMDEDERELRAPALVWVPALAVHGFRFAPETEGLVVTLDQGRLRDLLDHLPDLLESLSEPRLVPLERGATVTRALFAVGHGLREDYAGAAAWRDGSMPCPSQPRAMAVFRKKPGPQPMSKSFLREDGNSFSKSSSRSFCASSNQD